MIEQNQPDIVLLDIGMPVLDGFGVVRKIRENPRLAAMPVLAVTAYAMQGDREKILKSGFNGYLSKPVDARSLAEELKRLLSKREDRNSPPDQSNESQPDGRVRAAASSGNRSSLVLERLFFHCRYEVSDRLLILCTDLGELDSLTPVICPHHHAVSVDGHTGNG